MMTMSHILRFVNEDGRYFTTRIVRKNDYCGEDDLLIYQEDEPSLEFFDATDVSLQPEQKLFGYFTGIRCKISNLFVKEINLTAPINEHLWVWNISTANITEVKVWLLTQLNEIERQFIDLTQIHHTKILRPPDEDFEIEIVREDDAFDEIVKETSIEKIVTNQENSVQQQLHIAMQALDLAEKEEKNWQQGQVQLRLHILSAKKNILRAIALLTN